MEKIKILADAMSIWQTRYRSFGDYSATTLLNPPRMVQLQKRHPDAVERTVASQFAAFIGSGVHAHFEEMLRYKSVVEPRYELERTVMDKVCDRVITGKFDILWNGRHLYDIKTCFSEDTEILTPSGWKLFKNLEDDLVAQYSSKGEIEFVKPTNFIKTKSDKMYLFRNNRCSYSQFVTPEHKIVFHRSNGVLKEQVASEIRPNGKMKFPVSGIKVGGEDALSFWERFLIAYQADGCRGKKNNTGKTKGYRKIYFSFKKDRKKERFQWILDNLDLKYKKVDSKSRVGYTTWYVEVSTEIPKMFTWIDLNKVSGIWCREFLIELSHWDSHILSDCSLVAYTSKEKINTDIVQAICALTGYSSKYLYVDKQKENSNWNNCNIIYYRPCYSFTGQQISKEVINEEQDVYCVSVPSGMVVIRHNNCVCISGNCKVWKYVFDPGMEEWHKQLNIYAHLLRSRGLDIRSLNIIAIYLDWQRQRSYRGGENYPPQPVMEYELSMWEPERAERFLCDRVELMKSAEDVSDEALPACTEEETWQRHENGKPVVYAIMPGSDATRATKLCDTLEEARAFAAERKVKAGSFIEARYASAKRCEEYCSVRSVCSQFAAYAARRDGKAGLNERIEL